MLLAAWLRKRRVLPCGSNEALNARVHRILTVLCFAEAGVVALWALFAASAGVYHHACADEHERRRRDQAIRGRSR